MAEWTKALIPDDKDQIASDLLTVLQKIPISVIGTFHFFLGLIRDSRDSGQFNVNDGQNQIRSFQSTRHIIKSVRGYGRDQ